MSFPYPTKERAIEVLKEMKERTYHKYVASHSPIVHDEHCALQMAIDTLTLRD